MSAAALLVVVLACGAVVPTTPVGASSASTDEAVLSDRLQSVTRAAGHRIAPPVAGERTTPAGCFSAGAEDAVGDGAAVDIQTIAAIAHFCYPHDWSFFVQTDDRWEIDQLGVLYVSIDTDSSSATGCNGVDLAITAAPDDDYLRTATIRLPTCEESTWVVLGGAGVSHGISTISLSPVAPDLRSDGAFRWAASTRAAGASQVDRAPSAGWADVLLPCGAGANSLIDVSTRQVGGFYDAMTAGDFDGDDIDDLLFYGAGTAVEGLLHGVYSDGLQPVAHRPAVNGFYGQIAAGDFDGDGGDDVYFYGVGTRPDGYLAARPGSLRLRPVAGVVQASRPYDGMVAGDFDGDGQEDLFFYGAGARPDGYLTGTPLGLRAATVNAQVGGSYDGLAAGDINGDDFADIVFYGRGSKPEGILIGGPGGLRPSTPPTVSGWYDAMVAGDYDGDGDDDIYFIADGPACDGMLRSTPSGMFGVRAPDVNGPFDDLASGDFNGGPWQSVFLYGRGSRPELMMAGTGPFGPIWPTSG